MAPKNSYIMSPVQNWNFTQANQSPRLLFNDMIVSACLICYMFFIDDYDGWYFLSFYLLFALLMSCSISCLFCSLDFSSPLLFNVYILIFIFFICHRLMWHVITYNFHLWFNSIFKLINLIIRLFWNLSIKNILEHAEITRKIKQCRRRLPPTKSNLIS